MLCAPQTKFKSACLEWADNTNVRDGFLNPWATSNQMPTWLDTTQGKKTCCCFFVIWVNWPFKKIISKPFGGAKCMLTVCLPVLFIIVKAHILIFVPFYSFHLHLNVFLCSFCTWLPPPTTTQSCASWEGKGSAKPNTFFPVNPILWLWDGQSTHATLDFHSSSGKQQLPNLDRLL